MESKSFTILDGLTEMVLIENEVGDIKYANQTFCQWFGVTQEEVVGKSVFDFIIPEDREACNVEKAVTPDQPDYIIEGRSKKADGTIIWIQYAGRAYFDSDLALTGFQEIGVDITKWKEKIEDSARELMRTKKKLMETNADTAHRQRNLRKSPRLGEFIAIHEFTDIYTSNQKMKVLIAYAKSVAAGDATILIEGESGTGKELFAQAIHNASNRSNGPFVAINCGVIPGELISSEFFGYAEGAFTGASKGGKAGKFEIASSGTLFLDEIGEMPLAQQVALLRVLETKTVSRVGDDKVIPVDVRIICATNKDLQEEVKKGNFRADLYYRLNVINLRIPPLRERKEDLFLLIGVLIKKYGSHRFDHEKAFSDAQLMALYDYDWPGNVRELQNLVERLLYIPDGDVDEFFETIACGTQRIAEPENRSYHNKNEMDEKKRILACLNEFEGNISMAARKMQISRNTLYKKLKKYSIPYKRR